MLHEASLCCVPAECYCSPVRRQIDKETYDWIVISCGKPLCGGHDGPFTEMSETVLSLLSKWSRYDYRYVG